jgi:hypothetical protein
LHSQGVDSSTTPCCDSTVNDYWCQFGVQPSAKRTITVEQLHLSIEEMERRFEAQFDKEIGLMNERLSIFTAKHCQVECDLHPGSDQSSITAAANEIYRKHVSILEQNLESIEKSVGISAQASAGDNDEDRKRLKEKLKEAIEAEQQKRQGRNEKESWVEYIFGICERNGRAGKIGSRFAFLSFRKITMAILVLILNF